MHNRLFSLSSHRKAVSSETLYAAANSFFTFFHNVILFFSEISAVYRSAISVQSSGPYVLMIKFLPFSIEVFLPDVLLPASPALLHRADNISGQPVNPADTASLPFSLPYHVRKYTLPHNEAPSSDQSEHYKSEAEPALPEAHSHAI